MAALTWAENDERFYKSANREMAFLRTSLIIFLVGIFFLIFGVITADYEESPASFITLGTMSITMGLVAFCFLGASIHNNRVHNRSVLWQDRYRRVVKEICSLPIETLKGLCENFENSGDPESHQLGYNDSETNFSCEFSFDEFCHILKKSGKGSYEYILNWSPLVDNDLVKEAPPMKTTKKKKKLTNDGDASLVHGWFAEED